MVESIALKVVGAIVALIVLSLAIPKLFGRDARLRRKLRAAKQRAIRDLAESTRVPRRIAGMVVAIDEPLIAPLSGRPCVFYETHVRQTIGLPLTDWDFDFEVAREKRSVTFLVDDGTGTALVAPKHADMLLGTDVERPLSKRGDDAAAEDAFLARFGQRRRGLLFEKTLYFTESIIEVGERIAVSGTAEYDRSSSTAPDDPYRHQA